ncbi:GDP-mannose 4,6-dehydratase [Solirubrobacter taibaiensis]|nr:GDP-mannose 4,6-dehydratase [Solirubrobacter taibaiensis]
MTRPNIVGVTGAAGFVGANLVERLLDEGRTVIGIDDMSTGAIENVARFLDHPNFTLHQYDCRDTQRLRADWADVDGIIHLAAMKIPRYEGGLRTMQVNVDGSHAAFEVAIALDVPVVFASTSDVYGNAKAPFREDGEIVLGPPTSRRWCYATSKLFDEHLALRLAEEQGLKVAILRLFNCYGPYNHATWWGGPMSVFFEEMLDGKQIEIHGDGKQVRSFTFVSDTVDGFVRALDTPESWGEVINIGNDNPITIIDLAHKVQAAVGVEDAIPDHLTSFESMGANYQDVYYRVPSTEKAKRILGYEAQVGLDEGIERTLAYIRERRAAEASRDQTLASA